MKSALCLDYIRHQVFFFFSFVHLAYLFIFFSLEKCGKPLFFKHFLFFVLDGGFVRAECVISSGVLMITEMMIIMFM